MKKQIDNLVVDLTPEEECEFYAEIESAGVNNESSLVRYANELTNGNAENIQEATENLIKIVKED